MSHESRFDEDTDNVIKVLEELFVSCRYGNKKCDTCQFNFDTDLVKYNFINHVDAEVDCPLDVALLEFKTGPNKGIIHPWVVENWNTLKSKHKIILDLK